MVEFRISQVRSKVSLALSLIDAYTGRDPGDPTLRVILLDLPVKPIRKGRGLYIYENLMCEQVKVNVQSMWYEDIQLDISLTELDVSALQYITLIPTPSYPFPQSATLLRSLLMGGGKPKVGVSALAYALDPDCAVARISEDVPRSAQEADLILLSGNLRPSDLLAVWDTKKEAAAEIWTISGISENGARCMLSRPTADAYPRGTLLIPVSRGKSNRHGELVVPFRSNRVAVYTVRLQLSCGGTTMVREVEITEGTTALLGSIHLEP
jgi:hypothetical protein